LLFAHLLLIVYFNSLFELPSLHWEKGVGESRISVNFGIKDTLKNQQQARCTMFKNAIKSNERYYDVSKLHISCP